jgi:hypothetical protein
MQEKLFLYDKEIPFEEIAGSSIQLDSKNWKRPRALTLEVLAGVLNVKVSDEVIYERNVTSVEYVNQEGNPEIPPNTFRVNTRTHIAVDDNYLYVWVPSLNRWKRLILSSW